MFGLEFQKNRFRNVLKRLPEDGWLDKVIERFVYIVKKHEIHLGPSKGRAGEDGKDIVAIEDREDLSYCSYVIKAGHLNKKNLEGKYGILMQMRQAMMIELKDRRYHGKKRTAIIVHNGKVTNNSYHNTFVEEKERLEDEIGERLLRPIDRWDLNRITDLIFPHAEKLQLFEMQEILEEKQRRLEQINKEFINEMEMLSDTDNTVIVADIAWTQFVKLKENESNYPITFHKIGE
ncbi:hypothetical protein KA005_81555 [bacterium]|nr:hypothetical protein [bacterium]